MTKYVVAPDSFKESMTAKEVCDAMEKGIKEADSAAEVIKVPMADGGEGTVDSLCKYPNLVCSQHSQVDGKLAPKFGLDDVEI